METEKIMPLTLCVNRVSKTIPSEFDNSISYMEVLMKIGNKTDEIIKFINDTLTQSINEYINARFNEMMVDAMYDSTTETLVLSLNNGS